MSNFNNIDKRHATTLSEYIWKLKDKNISYTTEWRLISKAKAYSTTNKLCRLCLEEKYFIIFKPHLSSLNKRNELVNTCRHRKKHLLINYN